MGEWLDPSVSNLEVDIPDSDALQMDLCSPQITRDTQDRYVLESKDSIRKRGMPSPDEGDAIALTFAEPVSERTVKGNFRIKRQLG